MSSLFRSAFLALAIGLAWAAAPAEAAIADAPAVKDFPTPTAPAVRAAMKQAGWQEFAAADGVKMEDFQDGKTWPVYFVKGAKETIVYFARRGPDWAVSEIDNAPNLAATGGFEQTLYNLQARRIKAYALKHFPKPVKGAPTVRDVAGVPEDLALDPERCELRLSADGKRLAIDFEEMQAAHVRHHLLVAKAEGSGRFRVTDVFRGSEPPLR